MHDDHRPTDPIGRSPSEDRTLPLPPEAQPGMAVGPFHLRQKIAEGGMGEVWLAEQTTPVKRKVALKIVKLGMDSKEVVARFEAERQALALMNHSCVAKVFDAGSTPHGRPFFAMEYVPGIPITEYCDRHRFGLQSRLRLFNQVCEGVQHAHQKAIIHRDLKPSNVLVMEQDGVPIPKIIDFGVAKATSQKLTEKTMFTQLGVLIGTPEYMSPEQAELTGEDVDTRTDVYSLGVILYELLVGTLPFAAEELRKAGFDGIRKIIREREPQRPSTRVSTLGEGSDDQALNRQVTVSAWGHRLRGDLDWITMKALEKDRGRRYSTPVELSRDIDRHLRDLPVEARPPTLAYRSGRFIRRNRLPVAFAAVLTTLLIVSGAALAVLYARSLEAERLAAREATTSREALEFMTDLFRGADPFQRGSELPDALELLDSGAERLALLEDQPEVQIRLMQTIGDVYRELGSWDRARDLLETALEKRLALTGGLNDLQLATIQWLLGYTEILSEHYERAEELISSSLTTRLSLLAPDSPEVVESRHLLSFCYVRMERYEDADRQSSIVVEIARRRGDFIPRDFADYTFIHGWALFGLMRYEESIPLFEESLSVRRQSQEWETPGTGWTLNMYGRALISEGSEENVRKGIELLEEALRINTKIFDGDHVEIAFNKINIAFGHRKLGDYATAERFAREAIAMARPYFDEKGSLGTWTRSLSALVAQQGRHEEAESILVSLLERQKSITGSEEQQELTRKALEELRGKRGGR